MAIYEYRCDACRNTFTVSRPISEQREAKPKRPGCPKCGSRKTRQLFSTFFAKTSSKA
jgi:putative FmdB family regulatory protein